VGHEISGTEQARSEVHRNTRLPRQLFRLSCVYAAFRVAIAQIEEGLFALTAECKVN
jgi:hypothetical protein